MNYNRYAFTVTPAKRIRVITNTDAKNEADDQFAIVHTLLSPRFENVGMIAAHFGERPGRNPMEESYAECEKVMNIMGFDTDILAKGAPHALPDMQTPVDSAGARMIIEEAMKDDERPLFVTFMGPLTDMASAYLLEPRIAKRLTCIWIGGGAYPSGGQEYNLGNDIHAANVVFNSDIPVWQVPKNAYQQMLVSMAELELRVRPHGAIGKYLFDQLHEHFLTEDAQNSLVRTGEVWMLGDSPVVGLMLWEQRDDYDWVPAPNFTQDMHYIHNLNNRPIRVYRRIDSRFIMEDFYAKLALFARSC